MNEPPLSEDEIRRLQAELDRISVDDVLIQTVVTLLNVGARKAGLGDPGAPADLDQTRLAIDAARALMPLLDDRHGEQLGPVRDMIAQLQMAYAQKSGGAAPEAAQPPAGDAGSGGAAPGDRPPGGGSSGRLWVPGQ